MVTGRAWFPWSRRQLSSKKNKNKKIKETFMKKKTKLTI